MIFFCRFCPALVYSLNAFKITQFNFRGRTVGFLLPSKCPHNHENQVTILDFIKKN